MKLPCFKDKIIGGFDLLFLFGRGIEKFSGSKNEILMSLLVQLFLLPLSIAFSYFYPPKGMEAGFGHAQIIATALAQFVITYVLSYVGVWAIARSLNRQDKFRLFFSASNWLALPFFIVMIPFMLIAAFGIVPREEMDRIFVLFSCYSYIITACIAWRSFRINWQLAGLMSIMTLFVDQEFGYHLIYRLEGIPAPW